MTSFLKNERNTKRSINCFDYGNYFSYLLARLKNEGLIARTLRLYGKLRKFTVVSTVIRTAAFLVALLEKSAILLLVFSYFLLILPLAAAPALAVSAVSVVKYALCHRKIGEWVRSADKITVFVTSESVFGEKRPLFLREAEIEASGFDHPVIVICSDGFTVMRWYSLNLLAIKTDYFFVIRRFYFRKKGQRVVVRVIS